MQFSELIGRGALDDEDALLWFAGLPERTDQGEAAPNPDGSPAGRKRRPIMLYEPSVKFVECLIIDGAMDGVRRSVEPNQIGVATPDRTLESSDHVPAGRPTVAQQFTAGNPAGARVEVP